MMGRANPPQAKLFYTDFNLEARIRADHPLRAIGATIDFDFVYSEVADRYGDNGNVSVAPPVVLKLMLLLVLYNVRSERELMATLPERLDWLWFLGFDLDSAVPDHSVLSKARTRWGEEVFKGLFERVVGQCVQAGLVDGTKIFVDSSLIEANASNSSIVDTGSLKARLSQRYVELQKRLQESEPEIRTGQGEVNRRHVSGTDPDAAIVNRGRPKLLYQTNRAVDSKAEVITAVEITRGDVNEAHLLVPLTEQHWTNTGLSPETVVADSKYGTIGNFLACHDRGLAAHIPDLKQAALKRTGSRGIFLDTEFTYDANTDTYTCPAGQSLKRKSLHINRTSIDYAASRKVCNACALRDQCTRNKSGRTIKRHLRQEDLERMRQASRSAAARRDIRTRQHLMERSFARATRFGFDRARWRRLWRVKIQEYLVATVQNIEVLLRYARGPRRAAQSIREQVQRQGAALQLPMRRAQSPLCVALMFRFASD
jgi:transposase